MNPKYFSYLLITTLLLFFGGATSRSLLEGLFPQWLAAGRTDTRAAFSPPDAGTTRGITTTESKAAGSSTDALDNAGAGPALVTTSPAEVAPVVMQGLHGADPAAGITIMEAPAATNDGSAVISLPLHLPAGRQGMQPPPALTYHSEGGNGWLGQGWSLPITAVSIETRWGSPRYHPSLETETYLLDGAQLSPVSHRGEWLPRSTEKRFHPRIEGAFDKIVRHGANTSDYWWEVTTKEGLRRYYGGRPGSGVDTDAVLRDEAGNIAYWPLLEERDLNGNFVRYHYRQATDPGLAAGSVPGYQLYPERMTYTGFGEAEGPYEVRFISDRELGEQRRPDVEIDARWGFKMVTAERLRRIEVKYKGDLVRSYELIYREGAFFKSLLAAIVEKDRDGNEFYRHELAYFDEVRQGDTYSPFLATDNWRVPDDQLVGRIINPVPGFDGETSALGGSRSDNLSVGGAVTVGPNDFILVSKDKTAGATFSYANSNDEGLVALVDINGDGRPDKLYRKDNRLRYRPNLALPGRDGPGEFGDERPVLNITQFSRAKTNAYSVGFEGNPPFSFVGYENTNVTTTTDTYFSDFNGDDLIDIASGGTVYFNRLNADGDPVFAPTSAGTPSPILAGAAIDPAVVTVDSADLERRQDENPLHDVVRMWVAPYDGTININAPVRLREDTGDDARNYASKDGVRVSIQQGGIERWSQRIAADDFALKMPTGVDRLAVRRGDRIYFRLQSIFDGAYDQVLWDPEIAYVDRPAGELDANGKPVYRFRASSDFLVTSDASIALPLNGSVRVEGHFRKPVTSDDVRIEIIRSSEEDTTVVFSRLFPWDESVDEAVEFDLPAVADQELQFRVAAATQVDWPAIDWMPLLYYSSADSAVVTGANGEPLLSFCPAVNFTMYNRQVQPASVWTAPDSGQVIIRPELRLLADSLPVQDTITFSVKGIHRMYESVRLALDDGIAGPAPEIEIMVEAGDSLFMEYHTPDRGLAASIAGTEVLISFEGNAPMAWPAGLYAPVDPEQSIFGPLYRGWGHFAYNGNRERAGQPILENELKLDEALMNPPEDSIVNPEDLDGRYDPTQSIFVVLIADAKNACWLGYDNLAYLKAGLLSSSRLGEDDLSPAPPLSVGSGISAPNRVSVSRINSIAGGLGVSVVSGTASKTWNETEITLDVMDFNGDRFPDVINKSGIQYTNPRGGLEGGIVRHGLGHHLATSEAIGFTLGGDFVPSRTNNTGEPQGGSSGKKARAAKARRKSGKLSKSAKNASKTAGNSIGISGNFSDDGDVTVHSWVDINGDGLVDKVFQDGRAALNLGYRFAGPENWGFAAIQTGKSVDYGGGFGINIRNGSIAAGLSLSRTDYYSTQAMEDLNGDGLPDLITTVDPLRVRLNTGSGFGAETSWGGIDRLDEGSATGESLNTAFTVCVPVFFVKICFNPSSAVGQGVSRQKKEVSDVDGDGFPDFLISANDGSLSVRRSAIGRTNLLRRIDRPLGATITLDYRPVGNSASLPYSQWVLSSVEVTDGIAGDGADRTLKTFTYQGGRYDRHEREFYGFASVREDHRDTQADDAVYRSIVYRYDTISYYRQGLLLSESVLDAADVKHAETRYSYRLRDVLTGEALPEAYNADFGAAFPAMAEVRESYFEPSGELLLEHSRTFDYDAAGNVTTHTDFGDGSASGILTTTITYHDREELYLKSVPASIQQQVNGQIRRSQDTDINAAGKVTSLRQHLAEGVAATVDMKYDRYGNLIRITRPPNHQEERLHYEYRYDDEVYTYVVEVADGYGYRSTRQYDYLFGAILEMSDINGQRSAYTLDSRGRQRSFTGPYEQAAGAPYTVVYDYYPGAEVPYAVARHYDPEHQSDIEVVTFVDGLLRPVQTKHTGAIFAGDGVADRDVFIVSGAEFFDAFGRVVRRHHPIAEASGNAGRFNPGVDPIDPVVTSYDILNRPLSITLPDGVENRLDYGIAEDETGTLRFRTILTDGLGNRVENLTDARGRLRQSASFGPDGPIRTQYHYNGLSELQRTVDAEGNATIYTYDQLGRLLSLDHPDAGRTDYTYDLAGNVITRTTASLRQSIPNGGAIRYTYDKERLVQIDYPKNVFNKVRFHYGGPEAAHNRAGRIWLQEDGSGGKEFFFGPAGAVVKEIRTFLVNLANVQTFVSEYEYDHWGRLQQLIYPDGEIVRYAYNRAGNLRRMEGEKRGHGYVYVDQMGYDEFGAPVFVKYGNEVITRYSYEQRRRRLEKMQLGQGGSIIADKAYDYDPVGNLLSVGQAAGGDVSHRFAYDELYRLREATGAWESGGRQLRYELFMEYDRLHNPLFKAQSTYADGREDPRYSFVGEYRYEGSGPHIPTRIGDRRYTFDAGGRQAGWESDKAFRLVVWDEEDRVAGISDDGYVSQYTYDARGDRAIKSHGGSQGLFADAAPAGTIDHYANHYTLYVSPFMEAGKEGFTKHYFAGSLRILSKEGTGDFNRALLPPGQGISAGNVDYAQRIMLLQAALRDYYQQLKLPPGPPTLPGYYGQPAQTGEPLPPLEAAGPFSRPPVGWPQPQGPPDPNGPPGPPIWYGQPDDNSQVRAGYGFSSDFDVPEYEQFFYHSDHLGSLNYLTGSNGEVQLHREYLPFGEAFATEGAEESYPYRFNGKKQDEASDLYFYGARYYDPAVSLWLSVDPLSGQYPADNPYSYTFNNPVAYVDPDGQEGVEAPLVNGRVRQLIDIFDGGSRSPAAAGQRRPPASTTLQPSSSLWYSSSGAPIYPPNDGFEGSPYERLIRPGAVLTRYGHPGGSYVSPSTVPYGQRALPRGTDQEKPLFTYVVLKPFPVDAGKAAPWFGEPGGGTQFKLKGKLKVADLERKGYIRLLKKRPPPQRRD